MLVNVATSQPAAYRVLVLAAFSEGLPDLKQLGDTSDVAALVQAGSLHIDALTGDVNEDEIAQALLAGRYDIFHAALHGDQEGVALSNEFLEREQLGELLQVHGVSLAVLLSCESADVAQRVAQAGVCCVVGTTVKITNPAAYAFCLKFYRHLVQNRDATIAFEYARRLLKVSWRTWFTLVKAEDCRPGLVTDPLTRIDERLAHLETQVERCYQRLEETEMRILKMSTAGHEQITGATLQLVTLFQGLLGGKR